MLISTVYETLLWVVLLRFIPLITYFEVLFHYYGDVIFEFVSCPRYDISSSKNPLFSAKIMVKTFAFSQKQGIFGNQYFGAKSKVIAFAFSQK